MQETWVWSLGWEDPLEKKMRTYSSVLAWKKPMDGGAGWATVHSVAKSWTRLSDFTFTFYWKKSAFFPSIFKLLWMAAMTIHSKFLCGHMFSFLLGVYPRVHTLGAEFLGHVITLCLTFDRTTWLFSKVAEPFIFPSRVYEGPDFFRYWLLWFFSFLEWGIA